MERIYQKNFTVSHTEVDAFGRLKASALLGFMQEVAGSHYDLTEGEYIWVVSRHHVVISRLPGAGETISMETWALPPTKAAFPRATVCYDDRGEELFRSISLWVLIRKDSRAMVLPGKVNLPMVTTVRGLELPNPGSLAPRQFENSHSRRVYYSMLDVNGHMNNAKYLDWVEDLLPLSFHADNTIREFTICYLSEGMPDETVEIGYELNGKELRVEAVNQGSRVFAAQVSYEEIHG